MARLLRWVVNIILLCSILTAAALLVPPLVGMTTLMIDDVGVETNLPEGSVTYATSVSAQDLEVGDKILVTKDGNDYVYRLKNVDTGDGTCILEKVGGSAEDEVTTVFRNGAPRVIITLPLIGYIPMAMKSMEGIIIIALAVLFVIILFILAELWRTDKDEEKESEEEAEKSEVSPAENSGQTTEESAKRKKTRKGRYKPRVISENGETSSQIMEEANNAIASAVSDVFAEKMQNQDARTAEEQEIFDGLEEIDRKLREEREEHKADIEATKVMDFDLVGKSWSDSDKESEEIKSETKDISVEHLEKMDAEESVEKSEEESEETASEPEEAIQETVSEEETDEMEGVEQSEEKKSDDNPTFDYEKENFRQELEEFLDDSEDVEYIRQNQEPGEDSEKEDDEESRDEDETQETPEVIKDDDAGVTILDYSDLL